MNTAAAIGWVIVLVIIIILLAIIFKDKGIMSIINALFWLYIFFAFAYVVYESYVTYNMDPNAENQINIVFEELGNWVNNRIPAEQNFSYKIDRTNKKLVENYKKGYKLGYSIHLGQPDDISINRCEQRLLELGEQAYYLELRNKNINRIKSMVTEGVVLHDTDTMLESVYNYNPFDTIESVNGNHLYIYTRREWSWIEKNKSCPHTRIPISDIVLKNIVARKKIAEILTKEPFIYPVRIEGEPDHEELKSDKSMKSSDKSDIESVSNSSIRNKSFIKTVIQIDLPVMKNDHLINFLDKNFDDSLKNELLE